MKKSNQEDTRQHNSRVVLSTIYHAGEISRVDIARRTGLARTTVSEMVNGFMVDGLVVETGLAPSTGGKPAILLRVDGDARLMIGIDLGESAFRGGLVNLRGEILQAAQIPLGERDGQDALELVYALIQGLLDQADRPVIGIGVGTPGLMDPASGVIRQAINLNWQDLPLGDLLVSRFGLPVHIANDCQVAALGEFTFGQGKKGDNLILIKAGRGVGAGIVIGGQLFFGDHAGAGEIGHIKVLDDGERCRCGNFGCLETILGEPALLERARKLAGDQAQNLSLATLVEAYRAGDSGVVPLVNQAACALGRMAAYLVGAFNINRILIAGYLRRFEAGVLESVCQSMAAGSLPRLARQTEVAYASLGDEIVIQGAASLILKNELGLY